MFTRIKRVKQNGRIYEYLLLVEARRTGKRVTQRTICNFGRVDTLDPAMIDAVINGLSKYAQTALVLDLAKDESAYEKSAILGPLPVLHRLWQDLGIGNVLRHLGHDKAMPLETAAFAMVATRFLTPASKRATFLNELERYEWPDFESLSLHHLYHALDLLADAHESLERAVWTQVRSMFHPNVDLVLMDTTNTYVHGPTRGKLAQSGKSKEKRYDRRLVSVGLLVTRDGVPIGHEVFPGNTHDARAFEKMLSSLKERFAIGRVLICADRGMVSDAILASLREAGMEYVVGSRMTVRSETALSYRGAHWQEVEDLGVRIKELSIGDEAYVVVHNPKEEVHDRERRAEIVERLRAALAKSPSGSSLMRNTVYRPFLKMKGRAVDVNEDAIARGPRYDGKYVLRANTDLSGEEITRAYRQLYQVERAFRELKGPFELRPMYHFTDRRIRGHIVVCFLAYVLEMALRQALGGGVVAPEGQYREVLRDLEKVTVATLRSNNGRIHKLRTPLQGRAHEAYRALGLRPPPVLMNDHRAETPDRPIQTRL